MVKFKKTNNYKFWHSPIALIVLFAMVVFFSYNIAGLAKKSRDTNETRNLILKEIKYLKDKSESLNLEISELETDLGKEEELRRKLPVTKEGEKMVIILDEEPTLEVEAKEEEESRWSRFLEIFKNN
jgi:cell division protein FtsB